MNFKQFLKLNELYVKENGRNYFILPASIQNIKTCKDLNDVLIRNIRISEIFDCFCYIFKHFLKTKSGFDVNTRPKNIYTLNKLGIDFKKPFFKEKIIQKFLRYLTASDFVETQSLDNYENDVIYMFKIKNFAKRCRIEDCDPSLNKHMYLKFNFIYSYEIINNKKVFHVPSIKNDDDTKYILVEPESVTLYDISIHEDN